MTNPSIEIFASSTELHSYLSVTSSDGITTTYDYGAYNNGAGVVIADHIHTNQNSYIGSGKIDLTLDQYSNLQQYIVTSIISPPVYNWVVGMQCTTWALGALFAAYGASDLWSDLSINSFVVGTFFWNPITLAPELIIVRNISNWLSSGAKSVSTNMAQVVNWFNQTPARVDPIILDLNGDGVKLTSLTTSNAYFDLYGMGVAQKTGWIDSSDGFLVVDKNNNGVIDNISEMFGNASTNGFTALKAIDSNNDNIINASDATFSTLRVWQDANGNGITDAGELKTLAQLGISSNQNIFSIAA